MDKKLEALAKKILRILNKRGASVAVFLPAEAEMARLGGTYPPKGRRHLPDVLSFPEPKRFPHPEKRGHFLGEIYLNKDIMRRNPKRCRELLVHGLLHLLGFSHEGRRDTLKMESLEEKLLEKFFKSNPK